MRKAVHRTQKFFLLSERKPVWKVVFRITAQYTVIGLLWIFVTDMAVRFLIADPDLQNKLNLVKGSVFVLSTAIILYALLSPLLTKISDSEQVIIENRNELRTLLYYDQMTGLSNRIKLLERLPSFLEDNTDTGKALLYIDVDNIKLINDTMGHTYGDSLLAAIAQRLGSTLSPPDELYRMGGDEFAILVKFCLLTDLGEKTARILNLFDAPFRIENTLIHRTVSIGMALYPMHSTRADELLKFADIAMNLSKKAGKNRAISYNQSMIASLNERMSISEHLHDALQNGELELHYQPQIDVQTRKISGFEALLRWTSPALGSVAPDLFIGIAEETHLIIPIGEWVLAEACRFLKKMQTQGYTGLTMSVNISITQLLQEDFVPMVTRILRESDIDPSRLELEITESVLMESYTVIKEHLDMLREMGIEIALDDFGKGYSSLSYLEELPISTLKIDKMFIDNIHSVEKDSSLTGNIVRIGKKLGLRVVAEGVETDIQLEYLAWQQCDTIQGWIFCKALPASAAAVWARENLEKPVTSI